MNKCTLTTLVAVTLIAPPAIAGIVEFWQPNWLADVIVEPVTFELTVSAEAPA